MISVGKVIKKWRKEKGWTQKQLADQLRVSLRAVSYWEEDSKYPRQNIVIDKLQGLIPELRGRKELRNGEVRLQESVENEQGGPPEEILFSSLWDFAYEHPDLLELKYGQDKVIFTLRLPGANKGKPFVDEEAKEKAR